MKAYLVDGTYELFRAYYGGPPAERVGGREVGACRTLGRSLLALLRDPGVTHVACAFDHVIESFRNELFDGYKTGDGIDPDLFEQFELAERVSEALGIVTWPMVDFEADDALATAAEMCAGDPRIERVMICSPDKDLAQCVRGDRVMLLDRMRESMLDEGGVISKFGVEPRSIPDYLALVGDTADGIPGIPGWGAKSASTVLAAYGTLDDIPKDSTGWTVKVRGAERLAATLAERKEAALLYRTLATLRRDVPLGSSVDDLEWHGPHDAKIAALAQVLGDDGLGPRAEQVLSGRRSAGAM